MNEVFKIGDSVTLIDGSGIHILEVNKSYTIIDIASWSIGIGNIGQMLALENVENEPESYKKYPYFNSKRFTINLRKIRRQKLQKIYKLNETY